MRWFCSASVFCLAFAAGARILAPWQEYCHHELLETSEFLSILDEGKFWKYLEALSVRAKSHKEILNDLMGADERTSLGLSLKYRLMSARIQVYKSLLPPKAPECDSFALLGDVFYCNPENLEKQLPQKPHGRDTDENLYGHCYGGDGEGPLVILYSFIGSPNFPDFHKALLPLAASGRLRYLYRHLVSEECKPRGKAQMAGFGLELEMKSVSIEGGKVAVEGAFGSFVFSDPKDLDKGRVPDLGFQAIETVLHAKNSLRVLNFISENVPLVAEHLSSVSVSQRVRERATNLASHFNLPETIIVINGANVSPMDFNLQSLLEFIFDYQSLLGKYLARIDPAKKNALARTIMASSFEAKPSRFDTRTTAAVQLNDLENDERYKSWGTSLKGLLRPPTGQFYALARNIVAATIFWDLNQINLGDVDDVVDFVNKMVPVQLALVLVDPAQPELVDALYAVFLEYGRLAAIDFIRLVASIKAGGQKVDAQQLFQKVCTNQKINHHHSSLEELVQATKASDLREEAMSLAKRLSITEYPSIFVNGRPIGITRMSWQRDVIKAYQEEVYTIQVLLFSEKINNDIDYLESLFDEDSTLPSRHGRIFQDDLRKRYAGELPAWVTGWRHAGIAGDSGASCAFSVLVFADPTRTLDGRIIARWLEVLEKINRPARFRVVPAAQSDEDDFGSLEVLWQLSKEEISVREAFKMLENTKTVPVRDKDRLKRWVRENSQLVDSLNIGVEQGPVVSINGRLYGPFLESDAPLTLVDVKGWLQYEWNSRTERLAVLQKSMSLGGDSEALTAMTLFEGKMTELLLKHSNIFTGTSGMSMPIEKLCAFTAPQEDALISVSVLLNPFSLAAAKISAILLELGKHADVTVIMNVMTKYEGVPSTSIYRFYGFDGRLEPLPYGTKVAIMLSTPQAWDVEGGSDTTDVDNFLHDGQQEEVTFVMRGLILEGEAKVAQLQRGVPGLPVDLIQGGKVVRQSISIGPHGYTQLMAPAGIYTMDLAKNSALAVVSPVQVALDSLASNRGKLMVEVVGGDLQRLVTLNMMQLFKEEGRPAAAGQVNVFSIASGEMYERLVRIMMLSVVRNTKAPVKFWLFSNYVTPRFRESVGVIAERWGFDVEFVRYKWPVWLNVQSKKHRRVWAEKILLLDVFPLSVDRLVFVDADQVMRGDVAELAKIDMESKVYGFVPFCDSRRETEALRFWKTGFWRENLGGNFYHISALFVVDMALLRAGGVADRLRAHYQYLSNDPNSLANLDQDLPNSMQAQVPIYALPREWLWCETWCDDASKGRAKSIDLCNNPLRSETKLDQARRIIAEWTLYDEKIAAAIGPADEELPIDTDHSEL